MAGREESGHLVKVPLHRYGVEVGIFTGVACLGLVAFLAVVARDSSAFVLAVPTGMGLFMVVFGLYWRLNRGIFAVADERLSYSRSLPPYRSWSIGLSGIDRFEVAVRSERYSYESHSGVTRHGTKTIITLVVVDIEGKPWPLAQVPSLEEANVAVERLELLVAGDDPHPEDAAPELDDPVTILPLDEAPSWTKSAALTAGDGGVALRVGDEVHLAPWSAVRGHWVDDGPGPKRTVVALRRPWGCTPWWRVELDGDAATAWREQVRIHLEAPSTAGYRDAPAPVLHRRGPSRQLARLAWNDELPSRASGWDMELPPPPEEPDLRGPVAKLTPWLAAAFVGGMFGAMVAIPFARGSDANLIYAGGFVVGALLGLAFTWKVNVDLNPNKPLDRLRLVLVDEGYLVLGWADGEPRLESSGPWHNLTVDIGEHALTLLRDGRRFGGVLCDPDLLPPAALAAVLEGWRDAAARPES